MSKKLGVIGVGTARKWLGRFLASVFFSAIGSGAGGGA